ncbi:MAG: beta-Ala-His dipeptidase [Anaerolineales bacterium]|nr:beta-Ala-His dipeptidase [Anaerolineales bacterium]
MIPRANFRKISITVLLAAVLVMSSCKPAAPEIEETTVPTQAERAQLPNPASQNCVEQGGSLAIETRGDGGQFGVCYFEDNRQCEEWALLRGDCPVGGVKVTGYITPAGRYCAITGGEYSISTGGGTDDEQGACTLTDGSQCDAWEYYNGTCTTATPVPEAWDIQPLTMEVCNGQAQAMAHALEVIEVTQSEAPLFDFASDESGVGCQATVIGNGAQFASPEAVVNDLGGMLEEQGWSHDPQLVAGSSIGIGAGYRLGNQICLATAVWHPADPSLCPEDQETADCPLEPEQKIYTISLNCGVKRSAGQSGAEQAASDTPLAPDLIARAAMFKPLDMSQSALLADLSGWELAVLEKLLQAADLMDAAFWQQVDPGGEQLFRSLANTTDPAEQAMAFLLDVNYGRWDRFEDFAPFVGDEARPAGGYVYPPDLTKAELDAYLAAHPAEQEALLSPFTVVQRQGDRLVAVPYHQAYAAFVLPAADLLDQAAALSQNKSLATYLKLEAQALRTDEYFDANMAWLDLDSNIDVSIGPHETLDDQLTGQKAFYKANVLIVDRPAAQELAALMQAVPAMQAHLPVPAEFRPDQTGTMTPLVLADDVYRTGQVRAIMEAVAFSLPNDPKVWEAKGAKKVMMSNYLDARRTEVLTPLANAILAESSARQLDAQHYFNWVLLHEVAHTLGPRTVQKDGQQVTVTQALGQFYSPIEEGKADITGLYEVPFLLDQGILTGSLESYYVGYLAESLRSIRFGMGSAYGVTRSAAWNFFLEQGALVYNAAAGRFDVDVERMTAAIEQLAQTLLTIEGNGDPAAAQAYLDRYVSVKPELLELLNLADASVPVEFMPYQQPPELPEISAADALAPETIALQDALPSLSPQAVWQNFYHLTQIPRPSGHMEQIRELLVNFGAELGLETIVDETGNVLIRKPAAAGFENRQRVVLQAHMDMVPQAVDGKEFDFTSEPIQAFVSGDSIVTDGTTLGADNGIGIAMIMAVLQAETLQTGPLEALFTVDEETTMSGVNGLKGDLLQSKILINLDGEKHGEFTIGSAGGERASVRMTYTQEPVPERMPSYVVRVQGLLGGHSGVDINKGRGHATQLLARLLKAAEGPFELRLASLSGGTVSNAIPRAAEALIFLHMDQVEAFTAYVREYEATIRSEYATVEPNLAIQLDAVQPPAQVMDLAFQHTLLNVLVGIPQGVARMSTAVPGLVETSNNLGVVSALDGQLELMCTLRSSVDSQLKDMEQRISSVFELAGFPVEMDGWYSAWTPDPDSPILGLMKATYQEQFEMEPTISAVHAGLECGTIEGLYPGMDMISIGPDMENVHSPSERLSISSVEKVMALLTEVLRRLPDK